MFKSRRILDTFGMTYHQIDKFRHKIKTYEATRVILFDLFLHLSISLFVCTHLRYPNFSSLALETHPYLLRLFESLLYLQVLFLQSSPLTHK